jgi:hypothetical protein
MRMRATEVYVEEVSEALMQTLGRRITFAVLQGLDGAMFVAQLRLSGIAVPATAGLIFSAFASEWTPETPRCADKACGMFAMYPSDDRRGVEFGGEESVCRWCNESRTRSDVRRDVVRRLTGWERRELNKALHSAFATKGQWAQVFLLMDARREDVASDSVVLREMVDRLTVSYNKEPGQIGRVVAAASRTNPHNIALRDFSLQYAAAWSGID